MFSWLFKENKKELLAEPMFFGASTIDPAADYIKKKLENEQAELKKFRKIGEHFTYLGIDMIVVGYSQKCFSSHYTMTEKSAIVVEYLDKNLEILTATFLYGTSEYEAMLIEANKEVKKNYEE